MCTYSGRARGHVHARARTATYASSTAWSSRSGWQVLDVLGDALGAVTRAQDVVVDVGVVLGVLVLVLDIAHSLEPRDNNTHTRTRTRIFLSSFCIGTPQIVATSSASPIRQQFRRLGGP